MREKKKIKNQSSSTNVVKNVTSSEFKCTIFYSQKDFYMLLHQKSIFVTGIGTEVGKTFVSSLLVRAFEADYWKPIQAGEPTDSAYIQQQALQGTCIHPASYTLKMPASPHIAMQKEGVNIQSNVIYEHFLQIGTQMPSTKWLFIEGVGGLLSPINDEEQNIDLIRKLRVRVLIVSRHYLGSINHSLMTANILQAKGVEVLGWIFNGTCMDGYEEFIVRTTGIPKLYSLAEHTNPHDPILIKKIKKAIEPSLRVKTKHFFFL